MCLSVLPCLGRGDLRQQGTRLGLLAFGQVVEDVDDRVIPAALLRRLRPYLVGSAPDRQAAVGHEQPRCAQTTIAQVTQQLQPGLGRLAITGLDGQHLLTAVAHGADDDQQGSLVLLQSGLDVDAIGPDVNQLAVVQSALLPGLKLFLPLGPQTANGRSRQGGTITQQSPQRQLEVALRQAVQVELGQHLGHRLRAAHEQRQDPALKALFQSPNPRPSHLDRTRHQRQPARLAVSVTRPRVAVHRLPALVARASQNFRHLFLQHPLQQALDRRSGPGFQRLPRGHRRGYGFQRRFLHGDSLLPCPAPTGQLGFGYYKGRLGSPFLFFHTS